MVHVDSLVLSHPVTFKYGPFSCCPIALQSLSLHSPSHPLTTQLFIPFGAEAYEYMNDNTVWVTAEICRHKHCPRAGYRMWQRWLRVQQADNWHTKIPERALRVNTWFGAIHFVCAFVIKAGDNEWFPYICQYLAHWRTSWIYFNAQALFPFAVHLHLCGWDCEI